MHVINRENEHIWKMPEVKFILWLVYDITWIGLGGVSLVNVFWENVNDIEKIVIFLLFAIMAIYRIAGLHQDIKKKRLDNEARRIEIEKMKKPVRSKR